ncbi:MAG: cytochrome c maturation protein CcmE [Nitrospirae bacterium]|nr:cytochrome c maturation protein CcmE [Nitrospirota bacterium]
MTKTRWIALAVAVLAVVFLVYRGTRTGMVYYYTPTEIKALTSDQMRERIRVGGLVEHGSLVKEPGTLRMTFRITDGAQSVDVEFKGAPPDLFTDGKGAVAEGTISPGGPFMADNIMVKHSEEYKPVYGAPTGHKPDFETK